MKNAWPRELLFTQGVTKTCSGIYLAMDDHLYQ